MQLCANDLWEGSGIMCSAETSAHFFQTTRFGYSVSLLWEPIFSERIKILVYFSTLSLARPDTDRKWVRWLGVDALSPVPIKRDPLTIRHQRIPREPFTTLVSCREFPLRYSVGTTGRNATKHSRGFSNRGQWLASVGIAAQRLTVTSKALCKHFLCPIGGMVWLEVGYGSFVTSLQPVVIL
jgi:hypothetical protein